jgi:hypothetical protein
VSASVIAYVSLHGSEYRLVRRADEEDDEPLLVIERRTTDALDEVCWLAVASTTTFDVLEAYALGIGVRPAHAPEVPRIGEGLGDRLRDLASWVERHGIATEEVVNVSVEYRGELRAHVDPPVWRRLAEGHETDVVTKGDAHRVFVDGVEVLAFFVESTPNHSCTVPGCLDGEACAVLPEVPDGHRI